MTFQYDWFSHNIPVWQKVVVPNVPHGAQVLELGAFEGRATVWMAQNLPGSHITAVDTWRGSPEHKGIDMRQVLSNFYNNTLEFNVALVKRDTFSFLVDTLKCENKYDLIYVDASHTAHDTLLDGLLAWPLVKPGGLLIFDDYEWPGGTDEYDRPKLGINSFWRILRPAEFEVLHVGYQLILKKL